MRTFVKVISLTLALGSAGAWAADRPADGARPLSGAQGQTTPDAKNTGINERDKGGATLTPQKQSNRKADRKLLADVRRAVVDDKALSSTAHNVKIMVQSGAVTLRGPVMNMDEKARVETLVKQVAGVTSVDNQLDVKTQ